MQAVREGDVDRGCPDNHTRAHTGQDSHFHTSLANRLNKKAVHSCTCLNKRVGVVSNHKR